MFEKTKAELNKIKAMDRDKRLEYYKTYYLVPSIAILIGLLLFGWFIKDTVFQKKGACMGCAFGVELTDGQREALTDGYLQYYGINPRKYSVALATDNMFEGTDQQMDANSHEMALFAQIAAGEIYYLILDKGTLDMWANGGIYSRLDEVLGADELAGLEGMTVDVKDYNSDNMYATAINLRKLGFLNDDQEGYLVFTIGQPSNDFPASLINYMCEIK